MGKFFFWLVWIVELLAFIFFGGCLIVLLSSGADGKSIGLVFIILLVCAISVFGLFKSIDGLRQGKQVKQLVLYLALPLVAMFVGFGACVALFN